MEVTVCANEVMIMAFSAGIIALHVLMTNPSQ